MTATYTTEAETLARAFAAKFPTANTLRAVELCESGRISWVDVAALFARSYGEALAVVA